MDYSEYSNAGLEKDSQKLHDRIMDLQAQDPVANAAAIKAFQDGRAAIEKELRARELAEMEKKPQISSLTAGNKAEMSGLGKDMLAAIAQIPIFDAGSETSDFLAEPELPAATKAAIDAATAALEAAKAGIRALPEDALCCVCGRA